MLEGLCNGLGFRGLGFRVLGLLQGFPSAVTGVGDETFYSHSLMFPYSAPDTLFEFVRPCLTRNPKP